MKAIILAAGKATRLLPLTKETPQSMLKVNNKPILKHQIETLKSAGIKDILIITGYLSTSVEEFCKKEKIDFLFNPFFEVSGMAQTLWIAKEKIKDETLLLYSDVLFETDILKGLINKRGDAVLAIHKKNVREEAEKVLEEQGIIKSIEKKNGDKNGEYIGLAKLSEQGLKKLIKEIDLVSKENINHSFIQILNILIKKGEQIHSYDIKDAEYLDIDFPEDLKKAEEIFE